MIAEFEFYDNIFSKIGETEDGGLTRLLYSDEWFEAQNKMKEQMEIIGMSAEFDSVGNLFGTIQGSESDEIIGTGSHIDSVVNGGRLNGQYGIIASLIAVKNLYEKHGQPKKSLQVISMAEEEGSRFSYVFWGSKNIFNMVKSEEIE